jgi:hypothetical protein
MPVPTDGHRADADHVVFNRSWVQISVRIPANLIKIPRGFLRSSTQHIGTVPLNTPAILPTFIPVLKDTYIHTYLTHAYTSVNTMAVRVLVC